LVAGIFRVSPVRRLRPRRAPRSYTLEAAEADEVHRLALADGTFDPGEYTAYDGLDDSLRLVVSVAAPSIKFPRSTTASCY
jgi:hypothetical protein